jgi:hypothetical protein
MLNVIQLFDNVRSYDLIIIMCHFIVYVCLNQICKYTVTNDVSMEPKSVWSLKCFKIHREGFIGLVRMEIGLVSQLLVGISRPIPNFI